jgi:hypothetical protein
MCRTLFFTLKIIKTLFMITIAQDRCSVLASARLEGGRSTPTNFQNF